MIWAKNTFTLGRIGALGKLGSTRGVEPLVNAWPRFNASAIMWIELEQPVAKNWSFAVRRISAPNNHTTRLGGRFQT
jgi:hypothetical protein